MKAIVCGGREYADKERVYKILDGHARAGLNHIIVGGQRGADTLAEQWARSRCVPVTIVTANWILLGNGAGPSRNRLMAYMGPDLVIAFPGGSGTASMIGIAREKGIPVIEVEAG